MDELRDKVAREVRRLGGRLNSTILSLAVADQVLAIPEIAEALTEKRLNAMPPGQFAAMLLDNLPKRG